MRAKVFSIGLIAILATALLGAPANAAVSNGAKCTKAGAITKVGSKVYRCAKNPYFKPTIRTWTLKECLTAYGLWKSATRQYEDFKDLAKLAGAEGEASLLQLQKSITELEDTMKNEACVKGA